MNRKKQALGAAVLAGTLAFIGCKKTFDTEVKDILKNQYGMTEEQALVGVGGALRWRFMTERDGRFEFNYNAIPLTAQSDRLREMKSTVREILDPRGEMRRYVDTFQLRPNLERQEKVLDYRIDRLDWVTTYQKFERFMRNHPVRELPAGQNAQNPAGLTDLDILFPGTNLSELLRFTARYVEDARAGNRLTPVETLELVMQYDEEEANPDYPQVDPNNSTRWVKRSRAIRVLSFDCDSVPDHRTDYIEVYRLKEDRTPESHPALKAFRSQGSANLDVLVLDSDAANLQGHGIPDDVVQVSGLRRGSELYDDHRSVLESLFRRPEHRRPETPREAPMNVEIVRVGEVEQSEYVISPTGWACPVEYKVGNNYSLIVRFADEENPDPVNPRPRRIEYIAKRYRVPGTANDVQARVVEFYRVKPEFSQNVQLASIVHSRRMIEILIQGQAAVSAADSFFMQANAQGQAIPYRIDYDSGTLRVTIENKDNNPEPLYEAKKEIARPHDLNLRNDATQNNK